MYWHTIIKAANQTNGRSNRRGGGRCHRAEGWSPTRKSSEAAVAACAILPHTPDQKEVKTLASESFFIARMSDYLPLVQDGDVTVRLSWRRLDDEAVKEICEALMNRNSKVQELDL